MKTAITTRSKKMSSVTRDLNIAPSGSHQDYIAFNLAVEHSFRQITAM
jgi:hypothetical protein